MLGIYTHINQAIQSLQYGPLPALTEKRGDKWVEVSEDRYAEWLYNLYSQTEDPHQQVML